MPGNEIPENIHNFFEQDNSQGRQSQVGVGGWPILNNNPWVGILKQNGAPVTFNSKNYTSQSSGILLVLLFCELIIIQPLKFRLDYLIYL